MRFHILERGGHAGGKINFKTVSNRKPGILDEDSAKSFVELCNRLELSPVHFYDAVEDAVS